MLGTARFHHYYWFLLAYVLGATTTLQALADQFDGKWSGDIRCVMSDSRTFTKSVELVVEGGTVLLRNFVNPMRGNPLEYAGEIELEDGFFSTAGDITVGGEAVWGNGNTGTWGLSGKWGTELITLVGSRGTTGCEGTLYRDFSLVVGRAIDMMMGYVMVGDYEAAKKAIADGINVNARDHVGIPLVIGAVRSGELRIVRLLIESGADINATDSSGNTPLIVASREDNAELVAYLIEKGADSAHKSNFGFDAARFAKSDKVKTLLGVDTEVAKSTAEPATPDSSASPGTVSPNAAAEIARLRQKLEELRIANASRETTNAVGARVKKIQGLTGLATTDFGRYHALVIGINEYKHLPRLATAVNDAKAVARVLESDYGFAVKLLIDARRGDIVDALDSYRETLGPNDNLLIYYAGHGWLDQEVDRGYWLPADARGKRRTHWVSNATVTDTLKALGAKHVMVVADSCYSGTLVRSAAVGSRPRIGEYWKEMAKKWARVAITSGGLEPVADKGGGNHSPFAKAFIGALEKNRTIMDGTELFQTLRRPVMVAADQTPEYSDVRGAGHDGGDFLFVRKAGNIEDQQEVAMTHPRPSRPETLSTPAVGVFPAYQPGSTFKDCDSCPEMVVVPPGSFAMGSDAKEIAREKIDHKYAKREGPRHKVTIVQPFAIGRYEVTRGQFSAFVSATGYELPGKCKYYTGSEWRNSETKNWRDPGFSQTESHPVTCVSWNDAQAFVKWLSRKTGKHYRLPSESEWEYAARAGTSASRYWGDDASLACGYANIHDRTGQRVNHFKWMHYQCDDGFAQTAPVGRFGANAFGLHDILGNVVELVDDCFYENYDGAPADGSARMGGADCKKRVVRGGSWIFDPSFSRSAFRGSYRPDFRRSSVGFRVALSLPAR